MSLSKIILHFLYILSKKFQAKTKITSGLSLFNFVEIDGRFLDVLVMKKFCRNIDVQKLINSYHRLHCENTISVHDPIL